jgi:transaldolase
MAGSFRSVAQVEALAGCDRLAIAPDLLKQLMESEGEISRLLEPPQEDVFVPAPVVSETAFRCALSQDAIANEKLFEGIRGFVSDTEVLEQAIVRMIKSGTVQAGVADDAATPLAVLA